MIYFYNKSQQDALFLDFISVNNSTCFRQTYCLTKIELRNSSSGWLLL